MNEMLLGAIATCSIIIGLFFLRFWKTTGDRFFLFFALSFLIEGVNRVALYFFFDLRETSAIYYLIKLVVYGLIIVAILEKNKKQKI
jgi:hypothetical protein